jgi:hypothetical protein
MKEHLKKIVLIIHKSLIIYLAFFILICIIHLIGDSKIVPKYSERAISVLVIPVVCLILCKLILKKINSE